MFGYRSYSRVNSVSKKVTGAGQCLIFLPQCSLVDRTSLNRKRVLCQSFIDWQYVVLHYTSVL